MKRVLYSLVLPFFCVFTFAQNPVFNFSIEPKVLICNGVLGEYVYANKFNGKNGKLSQLDWRVKNIFMLGGCIFFHNTPHRTPFLTFSHSFYFYGAVPADSGLMSDSDWLNPDDSSMKVCYSESEEHLNNFFKVGTRFSVDLAIKKWLVISPIFEVRYSYFDFHAENGEGWYGNGSSKNVPYNSDEAMHYQKGELFPIDYTRHEFNTYIGAQFNFLVGVTKISMFEFSHTMLLSPFFFVRSYDKHHSSNDTDYYLDFIVSSFRSFAFNTSVGYRFNKNFALTVDASCAFTILTKGDSYFSKDGHSYSIFSKEQSEAACSKTTYSFGFALKYSIF